MLVCSHHGRWLNVMQNYLANNAICGSCSIYQYLNGIQLYTIGETSLERPGISCGKYSYKLNQLPDEKEVLWNNFSCVMMRRDFSEQNKFKDIIPEGQYHYGSDSCYCRTIIDKGYKNILINKAWIYHFNNRNMRGRYGKFNYTGY